MGGRRVAVGIKIIDLRSAGITRRAQEPPDSEKEREFLDAAAHKASHAWIARQFPIWRDVAFRWRALPQSMEQSACHFGLCLNSCDLRNRRRLQSHVVCCENANQPGQSREESFVRPGRPE